MRRRSFLAALGAALLAPFALPLLSRLAPRGRVLDFSDAKNWALYHRHPPVTHREGEPYRGWYGGGDTWSLHATLGPEKADEIARLWESGEDVHVLWTRTDGPKYRLASIEGTGRLTSFRRNPDSVEVVVVMDEPPPAFTLRFD